MLGILDVDVFRDPAPTLADRATNRFQRVPAAWSIAPSEHLRPVASQRLSMLSRHCHHLTRCRAIRVTFDRNLSQRVFSTALSDPFWATTRTIAKPRARQPLQSTWHHKSQRRGAKRKATLAVNDLPQGAIEGTPLPPQDDTEPEYPPLLQQVRNNMLKFGHCVVVTRVGGFYEV
jgi:hypothetical protein